MIYKSLAAPFPFYMNNVMFYKLKVFKSFYSIELIEEYS